MKKRFLLFMLPLVASLSFVSCEKEDDNKDDQVQTDKTCMEMCTTFGETNGVEYVDLGLPSGNLWAMMNVGADKIEARGNLYAWGETSPRENFIGCDYSYYKETESADGYTKYVPSDENNNVGFEGFSDGKYVLDLVDDVAHVQLGGSWRIPTRCDYEELIANCTSEWVTYEGVGGCKITAKNGKSIFLPAGWDEKSLSNGVNGIYWASTCNESGNGAYALDIAENENKCNITDPYPRTYGNCVRAVCPVK